MAKLKAQLDGKSVDEILQKWNNDMEGQIKSFQDDVAKLWDSELKLYEHLDTF